ncbi:MAG: hypothetical protein KM296_01880 [Brockia lithotrophica]|nr:hypothetical protein [Brockia lithotrophica]
MPDYPRSTVHPAGDADPYERHFLTVPEERTDEVYERFEDGLSSFPRRRHVAEAEDGPVFADNSPLDLSPPYIDAHGVHRRTPPRAFV